MREHNLDPGDATPLYHLCSVKSAADILINNAF